MGCQRRMTATYSSTSRETRCGPSGPRIRGAWSTCSAWSSPTTARAADTSVSGPTIVLARRKALVDFLDYVSERRAMYPGMHIYHYASYEVSALKRLTARHQLGESFLDTLLAEGVFVDLYSVVRQSIRVSQPSYSIKKLEPLYMGDDLRDEDEGVTTAAGSIIEYHEYVDACERGDDAAAEEKLAHIADYN